MRVIVRECRWLMNASIHKVTLKHQWGQEHVENNRDSGNLREHSEV